MKQIVTKSGKILVVEYPKEAYLIGTIDNPKFKYSIRFVDCPEINSIEYKELEPLGKLSELTDKDCEEFVENTVRCNNCNWEDCEDNLKTFVDMSEHIGKEIYYYKGCPNCETDDYLMDISKESFMSLLQSIGIDTSREHLIIKVL